MRDTGYLMTVPLHAEGSGQSRAVGMVLLEISGRGFIPVFRKAKEMKGQEAQMINSPLKGRFFTREEWEALSNTDKGPRVLRSCNWKRVDPRSLLEAWSPAFLTRDSLSGYIEDVHHFEALATGIYKEKGAMWGGIDKAKETWMWSEVLDWEQLAAISAALINPAEAKTFSNFIADLAPITALRIASGDENYKLPITHSPITSEMEGGLSEEMVKKLLSSPEEKVRKMALRYIGARKENVRGTQRRRS